MEEKVIRELKGHSGSRIFLMQQHSTPFIRKVGNVERNHERLCTLHQHGMPVPKVLKKREDVLDMEYIHGLDMKSYLLANSVPALTHFLIKTIGKLANNSTPKDYTSIYNEKLKWVDSVDDLPFSKNELISKLPTHIPQSLYHGDLTLENVMFAKDTFYLIDAVTVEYDSYVFDIAKLRQDLKCKWFLRNSSLMLDVKLQNIEEHLLTLFPEASNDALLILMLLRVYLHTKPNDDNRIFILREINKLWK